MRTSITAAGFRHCAKLVIADRSSAVMPQPTSPPSCSGTARIFSRKMPGIDIRRNSATAARQKSRSTRSTTCAECRNSLSRLLFMSGSRCMKACACVCIMPDIFWAHLWSNWNCLMKAISNVSCSPAISDAAISRFCTTRKPSAAAMC